MKFSETQSEWVRTALRLPQDLHSQVHQTAKLEDRTFNSQLVAMVREGMQARLGRQESGNVQAV